jgi:hypothetical protein
MKKTALILLLLGIGAHSLHAQQKTVHHLLVTFYENYSITGGKTLIETREDGTQTKKEIEMRQPTGLSNVMKNEDSVMSLLKPYFLAGWEIGAVSSTVQSSSYFVTRFFLRKEE